ncbi:MAG: phosphatase PAP2 family protein [Ideonella sp.]|nr:phosphatase PAP2 family protein [Ideonella sp.]
MPARGAARDAALLGLALLAVLAWDLSGGDVVLSAWAGGSAGFPLRHDGTWATWLHAAGRWLSGALLAALIVDAVWRDPPWRRHRARPGPDVAERRLVALATLLTLAAVPALKRASATSCPWDVAMFGGSVPYVPHWAWWGVDGGPGHCFPSGHAVAAFVFLVPVLAWRRHDPRVARGLLAALLLAGALFGGVQVLRGAHYLSHVLWSAWLCAALAVIAEAGWARSARRLARLPAPGAPPAGATMR